MSAAEAVDLETSDGNDDQATDPKPHTSRKVSSVYPDWDFEPAGMRDKTHKGAQCLPCAHYLKTKGVALDPRGTCLASLTDILTHVKGCQYHPQASNASRLHHCKHLQLHHCKHLQLHYCFLDTIAKLSQRICMHENCWSFRVGAALALQLYGVIVSQRHRPLQARQALDWIEVQCCFGCP